MKQSKGHWTKHSLAQGVLIHSVPRVFNYFRRHGMMKKTVAKKLLFVRDEFDTRGKLYFDALWVMSQKNVQDKELYYFHFHEVKSGKPNYRQMERQLRYVYPRKCGMLREDAARTKKIKFDALSHSLSLNVDEIESTESSMYYYIWIQKYYHADVYNHITNMGLESFVNRTIKIMDFNTLEEIVKEELECVS